MKLYETTAQFKEVQKMIDDGVPIEQLTDALECINDDFEGKVENSLFTIKNLEADILKIKAEETRLSGRRKAINNQVESIKRYLIEHMTAQGKLKFDNGVVRATIIKPKPVLVIVDEDLIPNDYKKISVTSAVNKKDLLAHLKTLDDGETIGGASIGQSKISLFY